MPYLNFYDKLISASEQNQALLDAINNQVNSGTFAQMLISADADNMLKKGTDGLLNVPNNREQILGEVANKLSEVVGANTVNNVPDLTQLYNTGRGTA